MNTLVLVPTNALLGQWKKELERFLIINFEAPEEQNFLPVLSSDIESARKMVVFSCKSLKYAKKSLCQTIIFATARGVDCVIYVRESSERDASFTDYGAKVVVKENLTMNERAFHRFGSAWVSDWIREQIESGEN